MTNTYHAAHFDPTVDEIDVLKRLEMGERITQDCALKERCSLSAPSWVMRAPISRRLRTSISSTAGQTWVA